MDGIIVLKCDLIITGPGIFLDNWTRNTFTDPLSTVLESQQVQTELAGFRRKDRIICSEGSDIQDRR